MTDEIVKNEKECNCICCKILKSECFRKFLMTLLASFIGCSLAVLLFAPKPPKIPCHRFMHKGPMMERPFPPQPYMHHRDFRGGEFKRHHRPPMGNFERKGIPERFENKLNDRRVPERKNFDAKRPVKELPQPEKVIE